VLEGTGKLATRLKETKKFATPPKNHFDTLGERERESYQAKCATSVGRD
jgi:hypothetical protein